MRIIPRCPEILSGLLCPVVGRMAHKPPSVAQVPFLQALLSPALVALALAPQVAHAQAYTWTGNSSNSSLWSVAENWGGTVPISNATTDLRFGAAANKLSVNDIADNFLLQYLRFLDSGYTISGSSSSSLLRFAGDSSQLIQTVAGTNSITSAISFDAITTIDIQNSGGTLNLTGTLSSANFSDALTKIGVGTLNLTGAGSRLNSSLFVNGGTVNIKSGGTVRNTSGYVGYNSGDSGTVVVDGAGSKWTNNSSLYIGYSGTGMLNIINGGTVTNSGDISSVSCYIGYGSGSSGAVTVDGVGSALDTSINSLYVGYTGTGTLSITNGGSVSGSYNCVGYNLGASGTVTVDGSGSTYHMSSLSIGYNGTGTLSITNGATLTTVLGYVGNNAGSTGTVTVDGSGSKWTYSSNLYVGNNGTGTLNITNGGIVTSDDAYVGNNTGSSGTVAVDGSGSKWISTWDLYVGQSGTGALSITNGGIVSDMTGTVGSSPGVSGIVAVDGAGSTWTNSGDLRIGYYGTGTLNVTNGGTVTSTSGYIGCGYVSEGSAGTVAIDGSGSNWMNSGSLYVGYFSTGTLSITNGSYVSDTNGYLGYIFGASGTVTVDGVGSTWTNSGDLYVGNGGTGILSIKNGGTVSNANSYITYWSYLPTNDSPSRSSSGTVTIDGSGSRWTNSGNLYVGYVTNSTSAPGTLNIQNSGTVSVSGATSINSASQITADNGTLNTGTLTGTGTVTLIKNGLTLNQSGNSTFDGTVSGTGNLIKSGSGNLTLAGTNSYTGSTTVNAGTLVFDSASKSSAYSVASGATLDLGGFVNNLSGTNMIVNGTVTGVGTGLGLTLGSILSGSGVVNGNVDNTSGVVSPGNSPGTLTINGNYTQGSDGALNIEITSLSSFDTLAITGNATLSGILNITFDSDFLASGSGSFDFLTAGGSINGFFDTVNTYRLPDGTDYQITVHSLAGGGQALSLAIVPEAGTDLLILLAAPGLLILLLRKKLKSA